jgi:eukaryotic-like serine/threonine-protein kinase
MRTPTVRFGPPMATGIDPSYPSTHPAILPPPDVLGYRDLQLRGKGGMGEVYEGIEIATGRPVAIKVIRSVPFALPEVRVRFIAREAPALARLDHPNIVRYLQHGEHGGQPFLIMEWVEGPTLAAAWGAKPQPPDCVAQTVEVLAQAIDYAHQAGVTHRDLKPSNVIRTPAGLLKIIDFGLARCPGPSAPLTKTGVIMGTPSYMSPEQAEGHVKNVGPKTDIWALGVLLYEGITGRRPFQGRTSIQTLMNICRQEPRLPRRLRSAVPPQLYAVCLKCLKKKPVERYATALDMADDLRRFLDGRQPLAGAEEVV